MTSKPFRLNFANLVSTGTLALQLKENLAQGLGVLSHSKNELVVAGIGGAANELAGLGIGTGDDEVLGAHDIPLEAGGNQAIDVLTDGDEDLSGEMTALESVSPRIKIVASVEHTFLPPCI